jgi:cell division protein FtsQ
LQQIGARTATVQAVDPRRLPVPVRRSGSRALVTAGHVWVLHKRIFVRSIAALICCMFIVLVYEGRDSIASAAFTLGGMMQGEFAEAGFAVGAINISGQAITDDKDIVTALALEPKVSTLNFDAEAARARLEELPAVAAATVRKVYPGQVMVNVSEKVPVARWRVDGVTFLVDSHGEQIGEDRGAYSELPLVVGDGAADDALSMIRVMDQHEPLKNGLIALSRIGDRRWDLIYDTGLRVQLPELGLAQALNQLEGFERDYQLLERDLTVIDMRVEGSVALRPTTPPVDPKTATKKTAQSTETLEAAHNDD